MEQLSLLETVSQKEQATSERLKIFMWVGRNATARGEYYHFYWQDRANEKPVTRNRFIRGSRVGSELGEQRRQLVLGWIAEGLHPLQICQKLEQFPRSTRRGRYPDWQAIATDQPAPICN